MVINENNFVDINSMDLDELDKLILDAENQKSKILEQETKVFDEVETNKEILNSILKVVTKLSASQEQLSASHKELSESIDLKVTNAINKAIKPLEDKITVLEKARNFNNAVNEAAANDLFYASEYSSVKNNGVVFSDIERAIQHHRTFLG